MPFEIKRGTNISHWLSQSRARGKERAAWFTRADVRRIAEYGFDHIRLPVDEEQLFSADGGKDTEAFDLLDSAIDWCAESGLRIIVDLHILRSHYFMDANNPPLFADPDAMYDFADRWHELSHHLHYRPADSVAYELLNEPVARDPEDWNRVFRTAFDEIREHEPGRTILVGSNWFNSVDTFDALKIPEDRNMILTFHYYLPMLVTHHQAGWWDGGKYAGPISYPGRPVLDAELEILKPGLRKVVSENNRPYDAAHMRLDMAKPLAARLRTKAPLYCGEFGCFNKAPLPVRLAWYRDILGVLQENGIGWANWDYKGGFGIVDKDGTETGILGTLMPRK